MALLFAEDLAYLPGLKRLRPPLASMPGTEVMPGSTLREFVSHELHSDDPDRTPEFVAWVQRAATKFGIT